MYSIYVIQSSTTKLVTIMIVIFHCILYICKCTYVQYVLHTNFYKFCSTLHKFSVKIVIICGYNEIMALGYT